MYYAERNLQIGDFMSKTQKTPACWLWLGRAGKNGRAQYRGQNAARVFMQWILGRTLDSKTEHVLHICHNNQCVRPTHLRVGTPAENYAEQWALRRQQKTM